MARIVVVAGGDNSVGVDGVIRGGLDLSNCNLPENFWALQWNEHGETNVGHIEYNSPNIANTEITELPSWVGSCIAVWQAKLDQEVTEAEAIRIAAEQAAAEQAAAEQAAAEQAAANEPATPV